MGGWPARPLAHGSENFLCNGWHGCRQSLAQHCQWGFFSNGVEWSGERIWDAGNETKYEINQVETKITDKRAQQRQKSGRALDTKGL